MPENPVRLFTSYHVKVNGTDLSEEKLDKITTITIEQNLQLPDAVTFVIRDAGVAGGGQDPLHFNFTDQQIIPIGSEVEISLGHDEKPTPVFKGEITAEELDIQPGSPAKYVLRGFDKSHRLQRGRAARTFTNMTDSDIAQKVASELGLQCETDATSESLPYVLQNNETNWEFLQRRAQRIGYEVYVEDKKLHFTKPRTSGGAQHALALWDKVIHLHLRMTSVGQVNEVSVHGWDPVQKQALSGLATSVSHSTAGGGGQKSAGALASSFDQAKMRVTNRPVKSQGEADAVAQSMLDDLAGNALQLEAEIKGTPSLKPGQVVELKEMGDRFSGKYYVTSAVHKVDNKQTYTTHISVCGRRANTLMDWMEATTSAKNGHGGSDAVVVGEVTNNNDPDKHSRVKVKFPWMGKDPNGTDVESEWARLAAPGGGSGRGMFWLPEVGDEVLIAFEHGDPHRPLVLGALWNGKDATPQDNSKVLGSGGQVNQRIIQSRTGHQVTLDDTDGKQKVLVKSQSGHQITLDDAGGSANVMVKSKAGHTIKLDDAGGGKVSVTDKSGNNTITIDSASNKITMSCNGDIELKAPTGKISISGLSVEITANTTVSVKGTASGTFDGGAMTTIQGAMVKIN